MHSYAWPEKTARQRGRGTDIRGASAAWPTAEQPPVHPARGIAGRHDQSRWRRAEATAAPRRKLPMVKPIVDALNRPLRRREILKGAAAVGIAGAFPAIITAPRLRGRQPDRRQLDPLAVQPLSRHLEQGRRGLRQVGRRRVRDAGHRGQQREGHRRHQGDPRQDRRQLRHQRRPQRQPGRPPDRRGLPRRPAPMSSPSGTSPPTCIPGTSTRTTSPTSRSAACPTARRWPRR